MLKFLLFLGGLIFFHELGHFLAARAVGVTVLRFSVGFGPKILGFKRGITEYWLSAIPLGGYVKFLGDDPENPPPTEEAKKGFLTTDLWRKTLIVLAGPVFNLVLPLLVFLPMHASESMLMPSVIGTVAADEPAWRGGIRPGDRVTAIGDREISYWWELVDAVSAAPGQQLTMRVDRDGTPTMLTVTPKAVAMAGFKELGLENTVGRIEVAPERTLPLVVVTKGGPGEIAGLRDFDAVLTVDGRDTRGYDDVAKAIHQARTRAVRLSVAATRPGDSRPESPRDVVIGPYGEDVPAGVEDGALVIASVEPDSPATRAGLKAGDQVLTMDKTTFSDWAFLVQTLARDPSLTRQMQIRRDGQVIDTTLSLANPDWQPGAAVPRFVATGASCRRGTVEPAAIPNEDRLRYAWNRSVTRTSEILVVTAAGIAGLLTGKVSVKEMGGPIMIYDLASSARGVEDFLGRLAWLSMSLGLLNLLPVPVLDGGHLLIFAIETVRRRPIGLKGRQIAAWVGMACLLTLMVVVFANDIERKWGVWSRLTGQ
jgi:regulator of sigma E protease